MTEQTPAPPRRRRHAAPTEPELAIVPVSPPEVRPVNVVRMDRGGINDVAADRVEVSMGGIGRVDAREVNVRLGGVGAARADVITVDRGSVGASLTGELHVKQGMATSVVARDAVIEQGFVRTLIAQHVTINRPTGVLVMLAGRVEGDVKPLLDWRGALAFGTAFGLLAAVGRLLRRGR